MKNCSNTVKNTCGSTTYSTCVVFEGTPNSQSEIYENSCFDQEEVTQDIYNQIEEIKTQTDLSELGNACLEYTLNEGKIIVKNVLLKYEEEICNLKQEIENLQNRQLCDIPIGECIESISCLGLPCDQTITTLGDWMSAVTTKICE